MGGVHSHSIGKIATNSVYDEINSITKKVNQKE